MEQIDDYEQLEFLAGGDQLISNRENEIDGSQLNNGPAQTRITPIQNNLQSHYQSGFESKEIQMKKTNQTQDFELYHMCNEASNFELNEQEVQLTQSALMSIPSNKPQYMNQDPGFLQETEEDHEFEGQSKLSNVTSVETRKQVGDYLFTQRQPQFQSSISKIYLATNKNTGFVAIRVIQKQTIPSNLLERFIQEHQNLQLTYRDKQNVAGVVDFFQTTGNIYIITEYFREGNLQSYLGLRGGQIEEREALILGQQILNGVEELRKDPTLKKHGNLKLENVFLQNIRATAPDGAAGQGFFGNLRVADFGKTYKILKNEKSKSDLDGENDIRSFALLMFSMLFGLLATAHMQNKEGFQRFMNQRSGKISETLEAILKSCLFDPQYEFENLCAAIKDELKKHLKINIPKHMEIGDNLATGISHNKKTLRSQLSNQNTNFSKTFEDLQKALQGGIVMNQVALQQNIKEQSHMKKEDFLPQIQTKPINQYPFLKSFQHSLKERNLEITLNVQSIPQEMVDSGNGIGSDILNSSLKNIPGEDNNVQTHQFEYSIYQNEFPQFRYNFSFIREVDAVSWDPYGLNVFYADDSLNQNRPSSFRVLESLDDVMKANQFPIKVFEAHTNRPYLLQTIIARDDIQFFSAIKEIAVNKYIQTYLTQLYSAQPQLAMAPEEQKVANGQKGKRKMTKLRTQKTQISLGHGVDSTLSSQAYNDLQINTLRDCFVIREKFSFIFYLMYDDIDFSLKDYITRNKFPFDEQVKSVECAIVTNELLEVMKQLNSIGIYHNNIAPENIYITPMREFKGNLNKSLSLLLPQVIQTIPNIPLQPIVAIDYKTLNTKVYQKMKNIKLKQINFLPTQTSTPKFTGPNVIAGITNMKPDKDENLYLNPILQDIYSLGMVICELRQGELLTSEKIPQIFENLDSDDTMYDVLLTCLSEQPIYRKSIIELMEEVKGDKPEEITMQKAYGLFRYELLSADAISELDGDLTKIIHSRASRIIGQLNESSNILKPLIKKYSMKNRLSNLPPHLNGEIFRVEVALKHEFAQLCRDCRDYQKALQSFNEALAILSQNIQVNQLDIANLLIRTGEICSKNDSRGMQLNLFKNALQIQRKYLGTGHHSMMKLTLYVGDAYLEQGEYQMALHSFQEASILAGNAVGLKGPWGSSLLQQLGASFFRMSEFENANNFFLKFQQGLKDNDMNDTTVMAQNFNNMGECNRLLCRYDLAKENYEEALRIMVNFNTEPDHQIIISQIYNNLGIVYQNQGQLKSALSLFEESIRILQNLLGEKHERTMEVLLNIATVFDEMGHHTLSTVYYDEIIKNLKEIKMNESVLMAETVQSKSLAYYHFNDFNKASQYMIEAIQIQTKVLGQFHISLANAIHNHALINHKIGLYRKAISLYDQAERIYIKKLPLDHVLIKTLKQNQKATVRFNQ